MYAVIQTVLSLPDSTRLLIRHPRLYFPDDLEAGPCWKKDVNENTTPVLLASEYHLSKILTEQMYLRKKNTTVIVIVVAVGRSTHFPLMKITLVVTPIIPLGSAGL